MKALANTSKQAATVYYIPLFPYLYTSAMLPHLLLVYIALGSHLLTGWWGSRPPP